MADQTFKDIARYVAKNGEKTDADEQRVYDFSELTLVADVEGTKVIPQALNFVAFGVDFTKTTKDELLIVDTTEDQVESFLVENEALIATIDEHLEWRLRALEGHRV